MITGCPSCRGEGWISTESEPPLSYWEGLGVLYRYQAPLGELIGHDLAKVEELDLESFSVGFHRCWCHHQIVQMAIGLGRPLYYEDEESGLLGAAVAHYFGAVDLTEGDLTLLKAYIGQFTVLLMDHAQATFPDGPYQRIPDEEWLIPLDRAANGQDLRAVLGRLLEDGIDPF